jgi:hypothetical protein
LAHDVTIVPESALVQLPVFTVLRRNVENSLITGLVDRLVAAVAPLRPMLVYLARRDPDAALRALGERIVEAIDVPKPVLDVTPDGWAERRRQIRDFVDVPFADEPAPDAAELERLVGRYRDGRREVTVEVVGGRAALRRAASGMGAPPGVFERVA